MTGWTRGQTGPKRGKKQRTGLVNVVVLVLVGGDTDVRSGSLGLTSGGGVLVGSPLLV
jgi:hypothetical protein